MTTVHAPSSDSAIKLGCTCPDQHNGTDALGIEWGDGWTMWAVRSDCPLHALALPVSAPGHASVR